MTTDAPMDIPFTRDDVLAWIATKPQDERILDDSVDICANCLFAQFLTYHYRHPMWVGMIHYYSLSTMNDGLQRKRTQLPKFVRAFISCSDREWTYGRAAASLQAQRDD